jgi:enoyl-CoA hydratase/carnithine racemase
MPEAIKYEKNNHIAILTMNRPEAMNAMNGAMRKEMGEAYVDFRDDIDSWVLIITGAGEKAFSAGMDLKEMAARLAGGPPPAGSAPPPEIPDLMEGKYRYQETIYASIMERQRRKDWNWRRPATSETHPKEPGWDWQTKRGIVPRR